MARLSKIGAWLTISLRSTLPFVRFANDDPACRSHREIVPLIAGFAVSDFTKFWKENKCEFLWCNGANFDEPILSTVYHRLGMEKPWRFFNVRCVRTIYSLADIKTGDLGPVTHHALQDCSKQIKGQVHSRRS